MHSISEFGDGEDVDCVAVLVDDTFIVGSHDDEVVAMQFTGTLDEATHFTLLGLYIAHVIANLHQSLDVILLTQDKVHFLVVA